MNISEAKQLADTKDPVQATLLEYIDFLEQRIFDMKRISESHRELVGNLMQEEKER